MPITAEILIFAWLLQQQPHYNLKQKMMKRFILSLAIRLPVIAGCEKTVAGTTDPEDGPGTFTIEATPSTTSVSLKVTPSDNEKPYLINFTTTQTQKSPAYVTASADNYWLINDLAEYNPDYDWLLSDPNNPVLVAIDFNFNESAESCQYVLWIGDITDVDYNELYNATMEIGNSVVYKGDPAPLYYTSLGSASTLCAIGIDADGNPGEMHMTLTTFPEEGKSTDYELFDKYYNQLTGYSMSSVITPRHAGICRPVQFPR